ncbi:MAG: proprotein convertase P-domain-containing protein [Saprospiraceae bacterium]
MNSHQQHLLFLAISWMFVSSIAFGNSFPKKIRDGRSALSTTIRPDAPSIDLEDNPALMAGTIYTYNNTTSGTLNDQSNCNTTLSRTFNVTDNFTINDLNVGLNFSHTWRGDVRVRLTSPLGTVVTLITQTNADNNDNQDFMLDDESANPINNGINNNTASPYYDADRSAAPSNPLSAFDGQNAFGTWTLEFCNVNQGSSGGRQLTFNRAQLLFDGNPAEICGNGLDDDGDGLIDDADTDCFSLYLEPECATIGANWNTVADATASNGQYLTIQNGFTSTGSAPTAAADRIRYTFDVPAAGSYKVFGRVKAPSGSDDSFWVRANGGTWYKWNDLPGGGAWTWEQLYDSDNGEAIVLFPLTIGSNTIDIAYREDGAQLDKIFVTLSSTTPSGIGSVGSNCFVPEICDNGVDDDGDGLIDCADTDCTVSDPGSISGIENSCGAYTPAAIASVSAGVAGASSLMHYQWQQTTDTIAGPWADLGSGDTLLTFQPPAISQTTFYRRKASTFHCADSLFSNIVAKAVDQNLTTSGLIGYFESVAGPYDPAAIVEIIAPSGGSGTIEYLWYSSTDGTWNLIPGATSSTYDPPLINESTMYRREARIAGCTGNPNCCGSTWLASNLVLKEVVPPLTGGGVIKFTGGPPTTGQSKVLGEAAPPDGLQASRANYQWEYSDDGKVWTELYGAIEADLPVCRFEQHNFFRRKVKNATHLPWEYSNTVTGGEIALAVGPAFSSSYENLFEDALPANTCYLSANLLLEGAKGNSALMRDDLRAEGVLPNFSPYSNKGSLPQVCVPGSVFQNTGDKAVVDWISLELYAALEDIAPTFSCPALLLRDGSIAGLDGHSPIAFAGLSGKKYHLLVRHRNHDPVASKKLKFKPGKAISITEFFTVENRRLGQKTDTMPSAIHHPEHSKIPGKGKTKGYGFYDFNMDGLVVPVGPGNEHGRFVKNHSLK